MRPTATGGIGTIPNRRPQPSGEAPVEARAEAGPRLASSPSIEPVAWWERQCPSCGRSFTREVNVCPSDGTSLRRVAVSLPFLWLG
jgi:hypothetical protein